MTTLKKLNGFYTFIPEAYKAQRKAERKARGIVLRPKKKKQSSWWNEASRPAKGFAKAASNFRHYGYNASFVSGGQCSGK
jgi:hypothetical protein